MHDTVEIKYRTWNAGLIILTGLIDEKESYKYFSI